MNELFRQGLQYLENVARGRTDRFERLMLYQITIMGIERCLHGRFERFGILPAHHQGEGLLNELLVNGLLPMDLAEELRDFMSLAAVHEATLRAEQLPWNEEEIRARAGRFHEAFRTLAAA